MANAQNTPRNWTSRRRHTKSPRTNAVAKKAPASMASETAFNQINSGFHRRHAPCGVSVDMSRISPRNRATISGQQFRPISPCQDSANLRAYLFMALFGHRSDDDEGRLLKAKRTCRLFRFG